MLHRIIENRLRAAIVATCGPEHAATDPLVRNSTNPAFGDYQANVAMSLAKLLGSKPRELAEELLSVLEVSDLCDEPPAVAGPGFINLRLGRAALERELARVDGATHGLPQESPETVVIDYSAPNVAKEMHVGHLRSTIIGDCLARVLTALGHDVRRQNHVGDWGTQFGMLIEHMVDEGWQDATEHSVQDLNAMYQAAKRKFDADLSFQARARERVVALQSGDPKTLTLWRALTEESKRHFSDAYTRLGVLLTEADIAGESLYNDQLDEVVEELATAGLAVTSQGALCVFPAGFQDKQGEPLPFLIRKSDGGYLYATTDLAALRHRLRVLGGTRLVYVTDARQRQHFAMLFAVARLAGWPRPGDRIEHVPFGMILGEDGTPLKTRSGDPVRLAVLLDEAVERARKILEEKNPELTPAERAEVARVVGIGAAKYADLSNDRVKDYVFSWDRMLSFQGNTAPYLQNAYVRVRSIFRKAAERGISTDVSAAGFALTEPAERALGLRVLQYPEAVLAVSDTLEPHRLCAYLYELAAELHRFYEQCPVLTAPTPELIASRLLLSDRVAGTLGHGLGLLGIGVVEKM